MILSAEVMLTGINWERLLIASERIVLVDITALVYAVSVVLDRLNCAYNCVFAGLKAPCDESRIMAQAGSSTGS